MSSDEIRERLLQLGQERLAAHVSGLDRNTSYMADLDDELATFRAAFVRAVVTEVATLRGELFGRDFG